MHRKRSCDMCGSIAISAEVSLKYVCGRLHRVRDEWCSNCGTLLYGYTIPMKDMKLSEAINPPVEYDEE